MLLRHRHHKHIFAQRHRLIRINVECIGKTHNTHIDFLLAQMLLLRLWVEVKNVGVISVMLSMEAL